MRWLIFCYALTASCDLHNGVRLLNIFQGASALAEHSETHYNDLSSRFEEMIQLSRPDKKKVCMAAVKAVALRHLLLGFEENKSGILTFASTLNNSVQSVPVRQKVYLERLLLSGKAMYSRIGEVAIGKRNTFKDSMLLTKGLRTGGGVPSDGLTDKHQG